MALLRDQPSSRSKQLKCLIRREWAFILNLITIFGILRQVYQTKKMKHIVQLNNNKMKNVRLQANQGLNNHHQKRLEDSFPRITQISIIGERNSGTSWIISHLRECFTESSGVRAIPKLVRFKHWFQEDLPPTDEEGERNNTVVIALFRDPYQVRQFLHTGLARLYCS